jgi:hypothetical protein
MRAPHHVFVERVNAGRFLDRALARYSAVESLWRGSLTVDKIMRFDRPHTRELSRRLTVARIALAEAVEASTRATARDTAWSNAMRRARRATRGRK